MIEVCPCVFMHIRKCSYLLYYSEETVIHEATHFLALKHTPLSDTHSLYYCSLAVLKPSGPGAMPQHRSPGPQEGHRQV